VERVARPGSVVVGDPGVLQQLDYVRKWKLADASLVRDTMGRMGGPPPGDGEEEGDRPSPRQVEKEEVRREKYGGTAEEREGKFAADVRAWAGGGKVYLVGSEREVKGMMGEGRVRVVERVKLPGEPTRMGGGRRGGMIGGMRGPGGMRPRMGGPQMFGGPPMMGGLGGMSEVVIAEWTH
jgi:hypothetical protein